MSGGAGNAGAFRGSDGFAIDIAEAKAFRDIQRRLTVLLRKRYGPSENRGPLTATEILEQSELDAAIGKSAATLVCPPGYGPGDAVNDSNRLHQLNCKRLSPPSCGGGELKGADDEEEAFLTARVAKIRGSSGLRREVNWNCSIAASTSPRDKGGSNRSNVVRKPDLGLDLSPARR